jgi:hypothetical protein
MNLRMMSAIIFVIVAIAIAVLYLFSSPALQTYFTPTTQTTSHTTTTTPQVPPFNNIPANSSATPPGLPN